MRKVASIAVAVALTCGFMTPASAAVNTRSTLSTPIIKAATSTAKPTIKTIPTKYVLKGKTSTIKPSVTKPSGVTVVSKLLSVSKDGKSVAKGVSSVKLKAGKYRVRTTVKYKVKVGSKWSSTKTMSKVQDLRVSTRTAEWIWFNEYTRELRNELNSLRKGEGMRALSYDASMTEQMLKVGEMHIGTRKWDSEYVRRNVHVQLESYWSIYDDPAYAAWVDAPNFIYYTHPFNENYSRVGMSYIYRLSFSDYGGDVIVFAKFGK